MAALAQRQGPTKSVGTEAMGNHTGTPHKVLLLGPRRAGKSSLCKVVYQSFQPNDTLFLAPTTKTQKLPVQTFQRLEILDIPGSVFQAFVPNLNDASLVATANESGFDTSWKDTSAVIFVIDAQDDYFDALSKLHQVILHAYRNNPGIHFHIFINKVDGLSDDYKYDTQRDIEQRVFEELIDSSHEFQENHSEPFRLESEVNLRFHLTSVFESSVFVAFSRIQQRLMQTENSRSASTTEVPAEEQVEVVPSPDKLVSLGDGIEAACNSLCSSCNFEKAYIFDMPSRTFVGCDTSPFDLPLFDVMFQYIRFLGSFSELYTSSIADETTVKRSYSSSVVRLGSESSVAFWQLNSHLALFVSVRTSIYTNNQGILDYNLHHFRKTVDQLEQLAIS
ncbi:GTP-binding protein gtr2 [Malassezia yamatoensis]|uniref:GTP-binding protein n=1 Tax=Malassezia yamatoensis TaxID=253288 RepID=A0AAJ5YRC0_9BASI|nr:GTP-binding protein gtr2 [Malassezia yamatoensis]